MNSSNTSWESEQSDEIFCGPVTKREIVSKLKYYNLLTKEMLDPLNNYMDEDQLDENLSLFYDDILYGKGNHINHTENDLSNIQDSLECITTDDLNCELAVTENNIKNEPEISSMQDTCQEIILQKSCVNEENIDNEMSYNLKMDNTVKEDIEESILSITSNLSNVSYEQSNSCVDSSTVLNDTLEEIELLMKYGVNYMNRDESVSSVTEYHTSPGKNLEKNASNLVETSDSIKSDETKFPVQRNFELLPARSIESNGTCNTDNTLHHDCQTSKECYLPKTSDINFGKLDSVVSNVECNRYLKITNRPGNSLSTTPNSLFQFNTPPVSRDAYPAPETVSITNERNKENKITTNQNTVQLKTPDTCIQLKTPIFKHHYPFKVPSVTKVSSTKKSPNFKSIVSPIAMYIKNSPKVPLVKNVISKQVTCLVRGSCQSTVVSAEKSQGVQTVIKPSLPVRSYKTAARNIFVSKEDEPAMPGNVRKLIKGPLNPEIIKHMGRMKDSPDRYPQAVPAIVQNHVDLTILSTSSASEGMFNVSTGPPGDISVLVSKNAARTNCLQKPTT